MTDQFDTTDPNEYAVTRSPQHSPDAPPIARYTNSDEFLTLAGQIASEEVYVPRIDRTLIVFELRPHEVARARQDVTETRGGRSVPRDDREFSAMVAYYATRNPDGSRFFRRDQIDAINTQAGYAAIQPISRAALRISGLDEEAEEMARKKHFEGGGKAD